MPAKIKRTKPKPIDLPGVTGPGVGLPSIPEIDNKAEEFIELDEELKSVKERHESAKLELAALMEQHAEELGRDGEGIVRYYSSEVCVSVEPGKRKLKVTTKTGGGDSGEHENN